MRILYIGELGFYSRAKQRMDTLAGLGHQVRGVGVFEGDGHLCAHPTIWSRAWHRSGFPLDSGGLNPRVLRECVSAAYDVVWIDKVTMLKRATLAALRTGQPRARFVSFSEDDMTLSHNSSYYYRSCIGLYDLVVTTKKSNLDRHELSDLGARRVLFTYQAFDPKLHCPVPVSEADRHEFGAPVTFVGTYEPHRAGILRRIAESGLRVRVWGNGWQNVPNTSNNLELTYRPLYNDEYVRAICASDVSMCFLRKINRDQHTSRSIEIPACGGLMLAERTDEHLFLFAEDSEALFFDGESAQEALEKIHFVLANPMKAASMRKAARERCMRSGYSHREQVDLVLSELFRY